MKKLLRIDASVIAEILRMHFNGECVWHSDTVVTFRGMDFGAGRFLFDIEHDDITEDIGMFALEPKPKEG